MVFLSGTLCPLWLSPLTLNLLDEKRPFLLFLPRV